MDEYISVKDAAKKWEISERHIHKLHKIYKELVKQNEAISVAEKERNVLEDKQGSLKGLLNRAGFLPNLSYSHERLCRLSEESG